MSEPILQALNLSVCFGKQRALEGVSLTAEAGSVTALIGPNGAGKSTLLRALAGLLPQATGTMTLHAADPRLLSASQAAQRRSYCPQQPSCAWDYRVDELGHILSATHAYSQWLETFDLAELRGRRLSELSGGEQKATHLALCFASIQEPYGHVLLLDEPTAALDLGRQAILAAAIRAQANAGATCLVASHDLAFVARCDQVMVLSEGRWVAGGPPRATLSTEVIREVWGVDAQSLERA